MSIEVAPPDAPERSYLRSRRLALWGLLIALPLALWVASGDHWLEYLRKNEERIIAAPPGVAVVFENSTWRLESAGILPADTMGALPPETTRVLVRISVTPQTAAAAKRLSDCDVWLTSRDGRRWTSAGTPFIRTSDLPRSCGGNDRVHPEAGTLFRFEQTFTVPASAADEVEPLIFLPRQKRDAPRTPFLRLRRR